MWVNLKSSAILALFFIMGMLSPVAMAGCYPISKDTQVVGQLQFTTIKKGDDFTTLAQRYDVGYDQIQEANPRLDSVKPLLHAVVVIPSEYLLPKVARRGIVVNLAQMRLFYFPKRQHEVCTYPVGIGKQNWQTPVGKLFIAQKIKNPVWIVPDSIMAYRQQHGDPVPKIVQSGPKNPLGYFAMRLSYPTYLIHGTDDPSSVGRRSSAGCIHLFAPDIESLFAMTPVHTPVKIINQPYLLAWHDKGLYFQASPLLSEMQQSFLNTPKQQQTILVNALGGTFAFSILGQYINEIKQIAAHPTGVPYRIL